MKTETPPATIKHIMLTAKAPTILIDDKSFNYGPNSNQYVTINELSPATKYTVSINVFYEEPSDKLYEGEETIFEIETLSASTLASLIIIIN